MDKSEILSAVRKALAGKIQNLQKLIDETRASNNETKSSMGDKYETGREMLQQEINNIQRQLNECLVQEQAVKRLNDEPCSKVKLGALVETDLGIFYFSTSVGEIVSDKRKIHTVSMESPIAKALAGKKKGDYFLVNNSSHVIKNIW